MQVQETPSRVANNRRLIKWFMLLTGVGMLVCSALVLLALILTPVVFRNLDENAQRRIANRLPFLRSLLPTPVVPPNAVVPTVIADSEGALALLGATPLPVSVNSQPTDVIPTAAPPTATFAPTLTATSTVLPPSATPDPPSQTPTALPATVTTGVTALAALPTNTPRNTASVPIQPSATPLPTDTVIPTDTPVPPSPTAIPATFTPLPTSTPLPPTIPPPPTLVPTSTEAPIPASFSLQGKMKWEPQLYNNCGPANLLQVLRYYGVRDYQVNVASFLKPNQQDKNVSPDELANYVRERTNLRVVVRYAGNMNLLKRLIAAKFGVIIETGFYDPDEPDQGWIGHYLTLLGYDDSTQIMTKLDSYKGVKQENYAVLDELWKHFNRVYMVVYTEKQEAELADILGPHADPEFNAQYALDLAKLEATRNVQDAYAWFNLGSSFTMLKSYGDAAVAYDKAFSLGSLPYRLTWYEFGFYEAYFYSGRYDRVIELANWNIETTKSHEETPFFWRGMVYAAQGKGTEALAEFDVALAFNSYFELAFEMRKAVENGTFSAAG